MSVLLHRRVESLMDAADAAQRSGQPEEASRLSLEAATLEEAAFRTIPPDRAQTRAVIAISGVALYRDAGAFNEAERFGHELLGLREHRLSEEAQREIYEIIADARLQRHARTAGVAWGKHVFEVSMEGGLAETGYAPLDVVAMKIQQVRNLILRLGEWELGEPFREKRSTPRKIEQLCSPLMGQPTFGSFRFQLRLAGPLQLQFPGMESLDKTLLPERVGVIFLDVVTSVVQEPPDHLYSIVPEPSYRDAFIKLVRNLAPDGKDIERMRISRVAGAEPASTVLTRAVVDIVREKFPPPPLSADAEEASVVGILRALSLDRRYLRLVQSDGNSVTCTFNPGQLFDDVVGPYVNHRVRALGYKRGKSVYIREILEEPEARFDGGPHPDLVNGRAG